MSHDIYNVDWEDRDEKRTQFSTNPGRSVQENMTFIDDRQYYFDQGYSWEEAAQRAWDHLYASRKAQKVSR